MSKLTELLVENTKSEQYQGFLAGAIGRGLYMDSSVASILTKSKPCAKTCVWWWYRCVGTSRNRAGNRLSRSWIARWPERLTSGRNNAALWYVNTALLWCCGYHNRIIGASQSSKLSQICNIIRPCCTTAMQHSKVEEEEEEEEEEVHDEDLERLKRLDTSDDEEEDQEDSIEHKQRSAQRALGDLEEVKKQAKERILAAKAAALESSNNTRRGIRLYAHPASVAVSMTELEQQSDGGN
eukprot:1180645-Prorocentrum_minimum.AAC.1